MASCLGHYFGGGVIGLITETIHVPPSHFCIRVTNITAWVATSYEWSVLPSEASMKSTSVLLVRAMSRSVVLWPGSVLMSVAHIATERRLCRCLWSVLQPGSTFDCAFITCRGQTKYKAYMWPVLLVCFLFLLLWTIPTHNAFESVCPHTWLSLNSELGKEFKGEMPWQGDLLVSKPGCACL